MAYFYKNGNGIDSSAYIYVQLQVTRTDYPTYSHFSVKSVAVSDTGSSSFIRGQVTTNQAGNSWTAATGWKNVSYNGTTTLATATFDVTRGASDKTARIGAYAEGGGTGIYAGGTDYAWLNVTVPKVLAPNAPTGCTATYVSDSQASVSWTNGTADTDHPRDATLVERRDGSNDWAQVASVSGTASGYTDNGISPNTQYQYRVRAKNAAGYSAYSTSGSIYTTPAAPASVTLDKTAATTVQVDVTGTWGYAVTYDVESTYDGGSTWASVATSTSLPYSATVNAGTVQFRVRAVRGALASAWTLSASLVTICPPLAPTIVQSPANPTAYGESSTITWTPNHPDGSTQSAAQIKVTNPGGTSTTYTVTTATSYTLTPNATGTWTAQVRTKGLDPSYGEWSQSVSWAVANPPAVVITSPATDGTDINALPMTVSWTVTDGTGVSTQRIIIEGGSEILNRTLAEDVRTLSLTASDVDLVDGETYTIRIRVMGGSGLVTEQTRIFDVSWLAPTAPLLQITEGEGESASIDVMATTYPESGTVLEASSAMMDSLTIDGLSVQDGTPTPSAPVAIESVQPANKLDTAGTFTKATTTYSGCKITNNGDGTYTVEGENTSGGWYFNSSSGSVALPAGTYTVCGGSELTGCTLYVYVGGSRRPSGSTFTLGSTENITKWAIYVDDYATISGTAAPALVTGGEVRPFVPYGSIAIVGDSATPSATPIPVTLRSLPDGTHDEWISGETEDTYIQRVGVLDGSSLTQYNANNGFIAYRYNPLNAGNTSFRCPLFSTSESFSSSNMTKECMQFSSVNDVYVALADTRPKTDFSLLYKLATPVTTTLAHVNLPYVDGSAWVDAEVTPSIEATFRPVDFPDQPAADSVDVIRVNADGSTWTVASGLSVGDTAIDPLPPLGVPVEYRAVGTAPSGATSSGSYTETFVGRDWVLNFGNAAQESILFRYNPEASYSLTQGGTSYHFADGGAGGGRPVYYATTDRDESGSLKFATIGKDDADRLRALCDRYPVAWLRDPFGHRWRAHVKPSWSHGVGQLWPVGIDWDAVRWQEAWDG